MSSSDTSRTFFLPTVPSIPLPGISSTYRRYTYGLVFHTHLFDDFGNELMYHAVATAWAVVHIVVVHQRRLLADDVLWLNYLISIHNDIALCLFYQFLQSIYNFLGIGNDTSQATELLYGNCAVGSQTNILYHLTSIDLGYQDTLYLL